MFTHSIRWRLLLWLAFLLVLILGGFGLTAYQLNRIGRLGEIDEALKKRVAALTADVRGTGTFGGPEPSRGGGPPGFGPNRDALSRKGPPPGGAPQFPSPEGMRGGPRGPGRGGGPGGEMFEEPAPRISARTAALFDEADPRGFYFATWSRTGPLRASSPNAPADVLAPNRSFTTTETGLRTRGTLREAYFVTERGDCLLAGVTIVHYFEATRRFAWWLVAAGAGVLAVGLGGAWLLATRALRPIDTISNTASRIAAGDLSERIPVAHASGELGRLASVLNSTFARLEAAFAQQKQFTADASHELRTPLAVIISETQGTLARERTAAEYRVTIETCLDVAQEMRRLSESLLELSRFDAGQEPLQRESLDLGEIAAGVIEQSRVLAGPRGVRIRTELAPAKVQGDAVRLGQVVRNLLQNAIEHNREGGEARVTTRAENGGALLIVADDGPGIATEDLPQLFTRFFRADKSRSRATGHTGLGLAIVKAIVDAHGGTIEVTSTPGAGATFTVRLPAS